MSVKRVVYTKVAGVTFEYRQETIGQLSGREPVRLEPEPDNKYDPNAIKVMVAVDVGDVQCIGYVPKDLAKTIAPHLDGEALMCKIEDITGGFGMGEYGLANYGVVLKIELPQ